jgi:tetratricopeptide (TPR) repeat protein
MDRITSLLRENGVVLGKTVRVACIFAFLFGFYMLFSNSIPMLTKDYEGAADSYVADRSLALYDAGLQRYRGGDNKGAVRVLNDAYNACLGAKGVVSDDKRKLAGDIKFLTGNALVGQKQLQQAVEAYKDALRLDPNNLYAKYNLELLQAMNGGKGPGPGPGDDSKPGGQPGKGIKKGI